MMHFWCLSVWRLSVAYIGPKSRIEKPRKTKIGTEVAHVTCDLDTTFKVKRSTCSGRGHIVAASRTACYWPIVLLLCRVHLLCLLKEKFEVFLQVEQAADNKWVIKKRPTVSYWLAKCHSWTAVLWRRSRWRERNNWCYCIWFSRGNGSNDWSIIHVSLSPFLSFFHLSLSLSVSLSLSLSLSHSLSLSMLTAIFPGEPGLVSFIEAKDDGSGGDNWGYKTYKAPVKSSPPTNQHPMFYFQMPSLCLCLSYLFNCWS